MFDCPTRKISTHKRGSDVETDEVSNLSGGVKNGSEKESIRGIR